VSIAKAIFGKATVAGVAALALVVTLCYLAVTGAVSGETFLAAVVSGPLGYLFGRAAQSE
jgi:hypothetical protein